MPAPAPVQAELAVLRSVPTRPELVLSASSTAVSIIQQRALLVPQWVHSEVPKSSALAWEFVAPTIVTHREVDSDKFAALDLVQFCHTDPAE